MAEVIFDPAHRAQVLQNELNFAAYNLPQLPDGDAAEVYARMEKAERDLASPTLLIAGYDDGTATVKDELRIDGYDTRYVLTSEHATAHVRTYKAGPKPKTADYGTAALGAVTSEDTGAVHITPLGKQTGDANHDISPGALKEELRKKLLLPTNLGHLSLHAVAKGRVETLADERGYNVLVGIGNEPTEETEQLVEVLRSVAKTYDLRLGVNRRILRFSGGSPKLTQDGSIETTVLSGSHPGTSRTFAQGVIAERGRPGATGQLELSTSVLFLPEDHPKWSKDRKTRQMSAYLGYLFLRDAVKALAPPLHKEVA